MCHLVWASRTKVTSGQGLPIVAHCGTRTPCFFFFFFVVVAKSPKTVKAAWENEGKCIVLQEDLQLRGHISFVRLRPLTGNR